VVTFGVCCDGLAEVCEKAGTTINGANSVNKSTYALSLRLIVPPSRVYVARGRVPYADTRARDGPTLPDFGWGQAIAGADAANGDEGAVTDPCWAKPRDREWRGVEPGGGSVSL